MTIQDTILQLARSSNVRSYFWKPNRGHAPPGYVNGMALTYGRIYCKWKRQDMVAVEIAKATRADGKDALDLYGGKFAAIGMDNSVDGIDTLRHVFVLLMGVGMLESSGRHCEGRDANAENTTAETAEAGLFQTSWNARSAHPLLVGLFEAYSSVPNGFVDIFAEGITCKEADWENFGTGRGRNFQELSKTCPAFAAEFAALGIRHRRNHWGTVRDLHCEIRPECDVLFRKVQAAIDADPNACTELV